MKFESPDPQATQFAITNLNVPDRLDLRDIHDREHAEESRRARNRGQMETVVRWGVRLTLGLVVLGVLVVGIEAWGVWRNTISAAVIADRLSSTLGTHVTVDSSQVTLSPAPRLVVRKISVGDRVSIDEVSIGLGIQGFSQLVRGKGVHWGEAVIHSARFSPEQGAFLVQLVPRLGTALPKGVTALRIERLELDGQTWLKGPAQLSTAREPNGEFVYAVLQTQVGKGNFRIQLSPGSIPASVRFQVEGKNVALPFGAQFPLEDVMAQGQMDAASLDISEYSLAGPFGLVKGMLAARQAAHGDWLVEGTGNSDSFDIESLIRQVAPVPEDDKDAKVPTLIQGTATFSGRLEGKGATLEEAVGKSAFSAPVAVRWSILNGVDLGYIATHPGSVGGTGGGNTRFTSMDAMVRVADGSVRVENIHARAGALAASGTLVVSPALGLDGTVHVDLGLLRVQAPMRVEIHGTIQRPVYGR